MRDDELDRMIDAGLSTYAEPSVGLEQRVLAAVAAERGVIPPRQAWRFWAFALTAAASVLLAILIGVHLANTPRSVHEQAIHTPEPLHRSAVAEVRSTAPPRIATMHQASRTPHPRKQAFAKQQLFPSVRPLNPATQALVNYLASAPEEQRKQFAQAQAQVDTPITIAPLQIAPLNESTNDEH